METRVQNAAPALFWLEAGLIFAGFMPRPADLNFFVSTDGDSLSTPSWFSLSDVFSVLVGIVQLMPAAPLAVGLWLALCGPCLPAALATFLAGMSLWIGWALTLVTCAFAGPGATLTFLYGGTLTVAIWASLALLSKAAPSARRQRRVRAALALASLAALWSLAAMAVAQISAKRIAAQRPYCLLRHDSFSPADPRGFFSYTSASGYKDSSTWYFHGLLLIETASGPAVYNWSPRRLRFDPIAQPEVFTAALPTACPQP